MIILYCILNFSYKSIPDLPIFISLESTFSMLSQRFPFCSTLQRNLELTFFKKLILLAGNFYSPNRIFRDWIEEWPSPPTCLHVYSTGATSHYTIFLNNLSPNSQNARTTSPISVATSVGVLTHRNDMWQFHQFSNLKNEHPYIFQNSTCLHVQCKESMLGLHVCLKIPLQLPHSV